MNSIIDIGGKQFQVKKGDILAIDLIDKEPKSKIEFNNVMIIKDGDKILKIGTPYVDDAKVEAEVIKHVKDDKVIAFKYKRRKRYKKLKGHRQKYTIIEIGNITVK